jgi:hypothetical protein
MSRTDFKTSTVLVPAGTYIIADPCYVIPNVEWQEFCAAFDWDTTTGVFEKHGMFAMGFSTAHGDGVFTDNYGNLYPVDSGTIGLVDVRWPEQQERPDNYLFPGPWTTVTFDEPTQVEVLNGNMTFGDHYIETDDPDPEDKD